MPQWSHDRWGFPVTSCLRSSQCIKDTLRLIGVLRKVKYFGLFAIVVGILIRIANYIEFATFMHSGCCLMHKFSIFAFYEEPVINSDDRTFFEALEDFRADIIHLISPIVTLMVDGPCILSITDVAMMFYP